MSQQTDNNTTANSPINPEPLLLQVPGPDTSKDSFTKLDAAGGESVKINELGPMVVNTDGVRLVCLSRRSRVGDGWLQRGWVELDSFPDRQLDANDRYGAREDAEASIRPKQVSDVRHLYYDEHEHSQLRSYSQASSCQWGKEAKGRRSRGCWPDRNLGWYVRRKQTRLDFGK